MPEFMSEQERHEAGLLSRELILSLGGKAVKDYEFTLTEPDKTDNLDVSL